MTPSDLGLAVQAFGDGAIIGEYRVGGETIDLKVIAKEQKKREESAEAFAAAGRTEQAAQERAEGEVLAGYLPTQLTDAELTEIASAAVAEVTAETGEKPGPRQMGQVMKKATAAAAGRADGKRLSTAVRSLL